MVDIRIKDLPNGTPNQNKRLPMDLTTAESATIKEIVYAGRPAATEAQAVAGTDFDAVMTSLTVKQSIASEVGSTIASAADGELASTSLQPASIGTTIQQYSPNLDTLSGVTPLAAGTSILALALSSDVRNFLDTAPYLDTRSAMKSLDTGKETVSILRETGREGIFNWRTGDFSSLIAADTSEAIYIKANSVAASAGAWVRVFTGGLNPKWFGAVGGGVDDTVPLQAALNFVGILGGCLDWGGAWTVSKINISTGSAFFELRGNAEIIANSGAAQTALIEIKRGNFTISGSVAAVNGYRTNYAYGFWVWHETQLQAVIFDKLIAAGCAVGAKIGNEAFPAAIISENTVEGFRTYGCPEVLHVVGTQTYGLINNPPAMSADAFGGDAAWVARKKRGIVNIGANSVNTGGEILQVTSSANTDYVFEMRPLVAAGELSWGRLKVIGSYVETAGPLCLINNPGGLTGLNTSKDRGRFVCSLVEGFVSGDTAPFIKVTSGSNFTGDIIVEYPNFWFPGTRSTANIDCGDNPCHVYVTGGNFGGGFQQPYAGVLGGILHFDRQVILEAFNLPAAPLATGVLKFQGVVGGGNLPRWQALYSAATGGFTVPLGGFKDLRIVVSVNATGITGSLNIKKNGTVVKIAPVTANVFDIEYTELEPAAGAVFTVDLSISSGSGSPTTSAGPNTLVIEASR